MTRALGPRDVVAARLWAAIVIAVGTAVFLGSALFSAPGLHPLQIVCGAVMALFCVVITLLPAGRTRLLCVAGPILGLAGIVLLDFATADATLTGQIFFCIPVLYAGVHLRPAGVVLVTAAAIAAETVVVCSLLPHDQAVTQLTFMNGTLVLLAAVLARAMANQARLVAKLRHQAAVDPLTGLVTRRVLDDATLMAIASGSDDPAAGTGLILIDVDEFKGINDTHGHAVGDDALVHIAAVLRSRCEMRDVVARMGGDELAVLMPGCTADAATRRAEEIVSAVRQQPLTVRGGHELSLSISAGAAHSREADCDPRDLYITADAALYDAKRRGRGRVGGVAYDTSR
jgi:diguanylate cyclase (GGDEF)-like protein